MTSLIQRARETPDDETVAAHFNIDMADWWRWPESERKKYRKRLTRLEAQEAKG